ncbi:MAG: DUF421 domain-containing protein [Rhodothermales bacterium]
MENVFFDSWSGLLRAGITATLFYFFIIVAIKVVGKRSTSKMNNFDWIVTVAIGAMAGSTILVKDIALFEGLFATAVLLGLQFVFTGISSRSERIGKALRARPTLLVYQGTYMEEEMHRERVSRGEIEGAVRRSGFSDLDQVWAVVLESNSELSVVGKREGEALAVLRGVRGVPEEARKAIKEAQEQAKAEAQKERENASSGPLSR